jgi:hypothetical protein
MGGLSVLHWAILSIPLLLLVVGIFVPTVKVLRRLGYSGWWSLVYFVPGGVILGLWLLAANKWPIESQSNA